jgi:hypothetical protein
MLIPKTITVRGNEQMFDKMVRDFLKGKAVKTINMSTCSIGNDVVYSCQVVYKKEV